MLTRAGAAAVITTARTLCVTPHPNLKLPAWRVLLRHRVLDDVGLEDIDALRAAGEVASEAIAAATEEQKALADSLEAVVGQFCLGLTSRPYHVHGMATVGERGLDGGSGRVADPAGRAPG